MVDDDRRIALSCELAHNRMFRESGETEESFNRNWLITEKDGSTRYTEEAQDVFDEYYDYYATIIDNYI